MLVEVEEVTCVDSFVVDEVIIINFSEFVSVEVCTPVFDCAVVPVLSEPVCRGEVDCLGRYSTVDSLVPYLVIGCFLIGLAEGIIKCIGLLQFEYVPELK